MTDSIKKDVPYSDADKPALPAAPAMGGEADVHEFVMQILSTCDVQRVLELANGQLGIMRELWTRGVAAEGTALTSLDGLADDAASASFSLPMETNSYSTVCGADILATASDAAAAAALSEIGRVTRRHALLRVSTHHVDGNGPVAARDRAWWDARCFAAGFRKHPLVQQLIPFEALEREGETLLLLLEKIPADALERYPLSALAEERGLHMDMLRESGRRSDAHIARYMLALPLVRPHAIVLDAGCGLGYGSHLLATASLARKVIGIDESAYAIDYARANFAVGSEASPEFRQGVVAELAGIGDATIDLVTAFEILEHLADPEAFLREVQRVLRPAGRLIVSIPNQWLDETGRDPNPHHLQVYDWQALREQIGRYLLPEQGHAQDAGGGMKRGDAARRMEAIDADAQQPGDAEWWLLTAMKDPLAEPRPPYREEDFARYGDVPQANITAFDRDYDNPYLVRAMVSIGLRSENARFLSRLARRALDAARPGSPDAGAAICVLGYRAPHKGPEENSGGFDLLERIEDYIARADDTPHAWRWRISLLFLGAQHELKYGRRAAARDYFVRCAESDCLRFSPLIATKTVAARHAAGLIAMLDGNSYGARNEWRLGLAEAERVMHADWAGLWGTREAPAQFAMPEATLVLDAAARCAAALHQAAEWATKPGLSWARAHENLEAQKNRWREVAEIRKSWIAQLEEAVRWHAQQTANWMVEARGGRADQEMLQTAWEKSSRFGEQALGEARKLTRALEEERSWTLTHAQALEAELMRYLESEQELRGWIDELERGKAWLTSQNENLEKETSRLGGIVAEQQAWNRELEASKRWLDEHSQATERDAEKMREALETQQAWNGELEEAKRWLAERGEALERESDKLRAAIAEQKNWNEELTAGNAWLNGQRESMERELALRDAATEELKLWTAQLNEAKTWLDGQLEASQTALAAREAENAELHGTMQTEREAHNAAKARYDELIAELEQSERSLGEARLWLEGQVENWRASHERAEGAAAELKAWNAQLESGKAWLENERQRLENERQQLESEATQRRRELKQAEASLNEAGREIEGLRSMLDECRKMSYFQFRAWKKSNKNRSQ